MVGFEVNYEEAFEFYFVIQGFDGIDKAFWNVWLGFEGSDGFVNDAGVDAEIVVFRWEGGFVVVTGVFVGG